MFKVDFCLQIINNAVMKQPKKANICMDTVPSYKCNSLETSVINNSFNIYYYVCLNRPSLVSMAVNS